MATVLNAYILPQVGRYYGRLARRAEALHIQAPMLIVKSNGGMASTAAAAAQPVLTVLGASRGSHGRYCGGTTGGLPELHLD